jgi:NADH:ubiquinone oxidoreductase subunit E
MNRARVKSVARAGVWIAGFLVVACVVILLTDCVLAAQRATRDDKLVTALQRQVRSQAALAPELAAQQRRITAVRRARKLRDHTVGWVLIAALAAFVACAKQSRQTSAPLPIPKSQPRLNGHNGAARLRAAPPTPDLDLTFVDRIVAQYGTGKEAAITQLEAIQTHYGYLPDEALRRLCELTEISPAEIAGTSSFYAQFRRTPAGRHLVRVCHGTTCHVAGARQINDELRRFLALPEGGDTDPARMFTVVEVACLGCCSLAPVLCVDGQTAGRLTPASACEALASFENGKRG